MTEEAALPEAYRGFYKYSDHDLIVAEVFDCVKKTEEYKRLCKWPFRGTPRPRPLRSLYGHR